MAVAVRIAGDADLEPGLAVWKSANAARGLRASPQRIARVQEKLADPGAVVPALVDFLADCSVRSTGSLVGVETWTVANTGRS